MDSYPDWVEDTDVRVLCKDCTAECCKHVAIPLETPEDADDWQAIADYLNYEGMSVYKDHDGDWLVECKTRCNQLDDNRCMAFKENMQPMTCREYDMHTCVMNSPGDYFTIMFTRPEEVVAHAKKKGFVVNPVLPNDCEHECCNHVLIELDDPEEWRDFDDIRWYIAHKNTDVFKDEDGWYVRFSTPRKDRCTRCDTERCKYDSDEYDVHFRTWDDVEAYYKEYDIMPELPGLTLTSY
ncbi:MAG: hypothetical protein OXR66_02125 [Candidatus Woesearchaeota archaeon]|nr:hypothetical protein [Candidatus Woesearchaeota archaeon]